MKLNALFMILLSILLSPEAGSQSFAVPSSHYVYNYYGYGSTGLTYLSFSKDTVINSSTYRVLEKNIHWTSSWSGDSLKQTLPPTFLRIEDGIVEHTFDFIEHDTLYQFGAPPGTKWSISTHLAREGSYNVEILDTFTQLINEVALSCQAVAYTVPFENIPVLVVPIDTVCERIGGRYLYLLPWDKILVDSDAGEGGPIRCYRDDGLGEVVLPSVFRPGTPPINLPCFPKTTSTRVAPAHEDIQYFPNPVFETLQIVNNLDRLTLIEISNLSGQILKLFNVHPGSTYLDVEDWPSGFYIARTKGLARAQSFIKI